MLNRFIIIALLLSLSSCFKSPSKSVVVSSNDNKSVIEVKEHHYPNRGKKESQEQQQSWSSIVDKVDKNKGFKGIDRVPSGDDILFSTKEFSSLETQHITNKSHNPFKDRSYFILPLSEMEESFCFPIKGKFLSNYGIRGSRMHTGVDIKAAPRDTIYAAFDGVVRLSKPYSGYGNVIAIRHFNGIETVYSHNAVNLVKVNQMVRCGDPVALAGRTGSATTEHLHFEVRVAGQHLNPNMFIDVHNHKLKSDDLYISKNGTKISVSKTIPRSANPNALAQDQSIDTKSVTSVKPSKVQKSTPTAKKKRTPSKSKGKVHTVKRGDTISAIARRYDTTATKLYRANGLNSRSVLQIGQKIKMK